MAASTTIKDSYPLLSVVTLCNITRMRRERRENYNIKRGIRLCKTISQWGNIGWYSFDDVIGSNVIMALIEMCAEDDCTVIPLPSLTVSSACRRLPVPIRRTGHFLFLKELMKTEPYVIVKYYGDDGKTRSYWVRKVIQTDHCGVKGQMLDPAQEWPDSTRKCCDLSLNSIVWQSITAVSQAELLLCGNRLIRNEVVNPDLNIVDTHCRRTLRGLKSTAIESGPLLDPQFNTESMPRLLIERLASIKQWADLSSITQTINKLLQERKALSENIQLQVDGVQAQLGQEIRVSSESLFETQPNDSEL